MKTIAMKMLVNFAMIQTLILINSVMLGLQIPFSSDAASAISFVWLLTFGFTFLPSLGVSFLFAALSK